MITEIDILTTLKPSPFLLRGHLAFETATSVFLLTDLLEGGDLFFHLDRQLDLGRDAFPEHQARTLLAELCLGLVHLHARGFLHLDLKIENVMFDGDGHIKIVDFGLAMEIDPLNDDARGVPLETAGSLIYMAPELLRKSMVAGRFSDWWSVGVIAHEVLTGASPWSTLTDASQIRKDIRTLEVCAPEEASPEAGHFVRSLLEKDRACRLGTADDLEVLEHQFFNGVDWNAMEKGQSQPAFDLRQEAGGASCVLAADAKESLDKYSSMVLLEEAQAAKEGKTPLRHLGLGFAACAPPLMATAVAEEEEEER